MKPRNNEYELFTTKGKTYCFDDMTLGSEPAIINAPDEMWVWLRSQSECRPMDETNVAYYLSPKLYMIWKLKWT